MIRTFIHTFDPSHASPVSGSTVDLDVQEIEDAGLKEVLQTPGVPFSSWAVLDSLLAPTGPNTPFVFREPLGQAREVRVALSGLFGRFVARAYLERYCGMSIFAHLGRRTVVLNGRRRIHIVRLARGDLPDWVACTAGLTNLTVAEAKGCHDLSGPGRTLSRAWNQANRIAVTAGHRRVRVKRMAVVTRWGVAQGGPAAACISVKDPEDEGELLSPDDEDAMFIGLMRHHFASLFLRLGYPELGAALRSLAEARLSRTVQQAGTQARQALDHIPLRAIDRGPDENPIGELVGVVMTRAGPVKDVVPAVGDRDALTRLDLRPVFIGVERTVIAAAIEGDAAAARSALTDVVRSDAVARANKVGEWLVPLGPDGRTVRDM